MFAVGVILFMIVLKSYPFRMATKDDKYYTLIHQDKFDDYWALMESRINKRNSLTPLSIEFKRLIFKLLCYDPEKRMTIS
jgi:serine/threonine protein kinase